MNSINILVAGPAGSGIESITYSLALSFTRDGFYTHTTSEYQNRIRGGHNYSYVKIANEHIYCHSNQFDIIIALDKTSIFEHENQLNSKGVIIYDSNLFQENEIKKLNKTNYLSVPLLDLANQAGLVLTANVVAVGAVLALFNYSINTFKTVLKSKFANKGEQILNINYNALQLGYNYISKLKINLIKFKIKPKKQTQALLNGNEAISIAAIKSGLKYLAAYPMTPASSIMTTLAQESEKYNIVVSHVEDEIAAINMAIGAGYTGVRAATCTSGGGFALMTEAIGMSGITEVPVVVFIAQRPGPSTGLPTLTGQGDLLMAINCGQGDFPLLVMAPGDHEECITLTAEAFNYAEKFQIPVIFLTDKYLADANKTCDLSILEDIKIDRGLLVDQQFLNEHLKKQKSCFFPRYKNTKTGISKRSIPGQPGGEHTATTYEHDVYGQSAEEDVDIKNMMKKRQQKEKNLTEVLPDPVFYPPLKYQSSSIQITFFIWGSTKGAALEAQKILATQLIQVSIVQMQYLHPFKTESVYKYLKKAKKIICIEGNESGQLESLLLKNTNIVPDFSLRWYHGKPLTGEWIAEQVVKSL